MKRATIAFIAASVSVLAIGGGPVTAPVAFADVTATGGSGTKVDTDGTQGDLKPAVQGSQDSDGDQDAYLFGSTMAVPQYKGR